MYYNLAMIWQIAVAALRALTVAHLSIALLLNASLKLVEMFSSGNLFKHSRTRLVQS